MSPEIIALIELHRGLPRQGPGDEAFSREILSVLPALPPSPRIADLGCGSGAGALLLAEHFHSRVRALDFCRLFLDELEAAATARGLISLVETVEGDMGAIDWPPHSLDLIWSEGAAYNIGFENALRLWRPLLAPSGLVVVSDMCWFTQEHPALAAGFWRDNYPGMDSERQSLVNAEAAGYQVLATRRLPSEAWWRNYYDPLQMRIEQLRPGADEHLLAAIDNCETEMALFRSHSDHYGYSFFVLQRTTDEPGPGLDSGG